MCVDRWGGVHVPYLSTLEAYKGDIYHFYKHQGRIIGFIAFAIVVLRSVEVLGRLRVDQAAATPWLRSRGARWFYVMAPTGNAGAGEPGWRARMQFYGGEDPATGSAAGCAISYLVAQGAVHSQQRIHVRQGVEMGRPSEIFLSAKLESSKVKDVHVGGSTVSVAKGQIFQP